VFRSGFFSGQPEEANFAIFGGAAKNPACVRVPLYYRVCAGEPGRLRSAGNFSARQRRQPPPAILSLSSTLMLRYRTLNMQKVFNQQVGKGNQEEGKDDNNQIDQGCIVQPEHHGRESDEIGCSVFPQRLQRCKPFSCV
jgi:hypothetical protein